MTQAGRAELDGGEVSRRAVLAVGAVCLASVGVDARSESFTQAGLQFFKRGGQQVSQDTLLKMEVRRARYMMSLLSRKLNTQAMIDLFAEEIAEFEAQEAVRHKSTTGGFVESVVFVKVPQGNAAEFIQWFHAGYNGGKNAPAMQRAHPEHLGAMLLSDGRVGIVETTGHTQGPGLHRLRPLRDWTGVPIALDPDMPHRIMGRGETAKGETTAYLLHQFRDRPQGFDARLAVYWMAGTPQSLVAGHEDHLLIEFSNWFEMYLQTRRQPSDLMPIALTVNT